MKFEDIKEHTWVKYLGDYFFVRLVEDYECYLENELDEIELTADDFETYHIEPVEAPIFKAGDQVLVVSKMIGNLSKNQILSSRITKLTIQFYMVI